MNRPDHSASAAHGFIVAPLDGPPTGGTLYNSNLIDALHVAGTSLRIWSIDNADALSASDAQQFWVDSLYLESVPELRARLGATPLGLLLHYLPSLVRVGRTLHRDELTSVERTALQAVDAFIVTSPFMAHQLAALGYPEEHVRCIEPGVQQGLQRPTSRRPAATVRAAMLCSVVEAKGVLPFIEALAAFAEPGDRFHLCIAGSVEGEPAYAAKCRSQVIEDAQLRARVELVGALAHTDALSLLLESDLLLSASRMESYGMALAEARALGIPIIACDGGHARAHIDAAAGGILVPSPRELAYTFLDVVRAQGALEVRQQAARQHCRTRSWATAAAEFLASR